MKCKVLFLNLKINKMVMLMILVLNITDYAFAQKYDAESKCNKCLKVKNFEVGDTLYTTCNFDVLGDSVSFDSFDSPLLDSVAVSLMKTPNIVVVLTAWMPISKAYHDKAIKKRYNLKEATMVKFTYIRANHIEYYLRKHGVSNCIISIGGGYKIYYNKKLSEAEENCLSATQITFVNRGQYHCFSLEKDKPFVLQFIYFDVDKWDILPDSKTELDLFANYLINHPKLKIEISGHTDNSGDYNKNIELSKKRAEAIAAYLKTKFVKNTIETKGYGSSKPFRTNNNEIGRAQNRRIEVRLIK